MLTSTHFHDMFMGSAVMIEFALYLYAMWLCYKSSRKES